VVTVNGKQLNERNQMKVFTQNDVQPHGAALPDCGSLSSEKNDLVYSPLDWQRAGLSQTATGYGRKLTTQSKINFCGKLYRIYATCFSNAGSYWFIVKGKKIFVN
jgi:hypothetical protein